MAAPPPPPGFVPLNNDLGSSLQPGTPPPPPGFVPIDGEPQRGLIDDVGTSGAQGIIKGAAGLSMLPYRGIDWLLETASGGRVGLPDANDMTLWGGLLNPPAPETTAGRYAQTVGEAVGGSMVPMGAALARAGQVAGPTASTVVGQIGQNIVQSARSNPGAFVAGDAASAVTGGLAQQAAAEAGAPPGVQMLAGVAGGTVPGVVSAYRAPSGAPVGSPTAQGIAGQRAQEAARDAAAFDSHEIRPFGPAFNQGPVASIGKQLTETAYIGAPLRNNLDETMHDAATATNRLANDISPNAMAETAGVAVQRGLERYARDGMTRIDPDRLTAIGIDPNAPLQPPQIMSRLAAGRLLEAEDIRATERQAAHQAAIVNGATPDEATRIANAQVPPLAQGRNQLMQARRDVGDLSDVELNAVRSTPSVQTSFAVRREAEYEHAWRQIPGQMRADGSVNPQRLAAVNLRQSLDQIQGDIANQISGQGVVGGPLAARIGNHNSHFSLGDLRAIRTEIGRSMDDYNPVHQSLSRNQLSQLYAAASRDIEVGVQDLANRALINSRLPATSPDHVAPAVAHQAARALRAFQRADQYTRLGMERIERFNSILQTDNPQASAAKLISAATDGTRGNMRMFRAAMTTLNPADRAEFGALVVRELGNPTPGARGMIQEAGFSPNVFVTKYQKMSPEARNLTFTPQHQSALEDLFRVANRLANVEALANNSKTATNAINLTGGAAAINSMLHGDFQTPLIIGGSGYASSILMSRPEYTRWMTQYLQLRAAISDGSSRTMAPLARHIMGLEPDARYNPELWPVYATIAAENGIDANENKEQAVTRASATDRQGAFVRTTGASDPASAVQAVGRFVQETGPNLKIARTAMQSLNPDERYAVTSRILGSMGQTQGPDGAAGPFDVTAYSAKWQAVPDRGRATLFHGLEQGARGRIEGMVAATERLRQLSAGTATPMAVNAVGNAILDAGGPDALGRFMASKAGALWATSVINTTIYSKARGYETGPDHMLAQLKALESSAASDKIVGPMIKAAVGRVRAETASAAHPAAAMH